MPVALLNIDPACSTICCAPLLARFGATQVIGSAASATSLICVNTGPTTSFTLETTALTGAATALATDETALPTLLNALLSQLAS